MLEKIKQITLTTDELEIYIDEIEMDDEYNNGKYTTEVYEKKDDILKLVTRLILDDCEQALNYALCRLDTKSKIELKALEGKE